MFVIAAADETDGVIINLYEITGAELLAIISGVAKATVAIRISLILVVFLRVMAFVSRVYKSLFITFLLCYIPAEKGNFLKQVNLSNCTWDDYCINSVNIIYVIDNTYATAELCFHLG